MEAVQARGPAAIPKEARGTGGLTPAAKSGRARLKGRSKHRATSQQGSPSHPPLPSSGGFLLLRLLLSPRFRQGKAGHVEGPARIPTWRL